MLTCTHDSFCNFNVFAKFALDAAMVMNLLACQILVLKLKSCFYLLLILFCLTLIFGGWTKMCYNNSLARHMPVLFTSVN